MLGRFWAWTGDVSLANATDGAILIRVDDAVNLILQKAVRLECLLMPNCWQDIR